MHHKFPLPALQLGLAFSPFPEVGLQGQLSNPWKEMCHCHGGGDFVAFLGSPVFAQGDVHPRVDLGLVCVVVIWQKDLFEFTLIVEMALKREFRGGSGRRKGRKLYILGVEKAFANRCGAETPFTGDLFPIFFSSLPTEASNSS